MAVAYTAQLGNGVTATISAEQRRGAQMCDVLAANAGLGTCTTGGAGAGGGSLVGDLAIPQAANNSLAGYGGNTAPDIVGNIRVDQTWGSAQVMAVAHNDNAPYYGTTPGTGGPSQTWGWVVGAGLRLNFPMIAQGDYFQSQVNYTQGALRYVDMSESAGTLTNGSGNNLAYGLMSDCVYGATAAVPGVAPTAATGCNLTTGWGVNAGYEHYWTPQFHESFVFGYMGVRYNSQANALVCVSEGNAVGSGSAAVAGPGCNNNWDIISGSTRFQYNVTSSLYLGVEFLYQHYDSASINAAGTLGTGIAAVETSAGYNATSVVKDENNLAITARIHKDFLP